jgi:hypothetical protein
MHEERLAGSPRLDEIPHEMPRSQPVLEAGSGEKEEAREQPR